MSLDEPFAGRRHYQRALWEYYSALYENQCTISSHYRLDEQFFGRSAAHHVESPCQVRSVRIDCLARAGRDLIGTSIQSYQVLKRFLLHEEALSPFHGPRRRRLAMLSKHGQDLNCMDWILAWCNDRDGVAWSAASVLATFRASGPRTCAQPQFGG